MNFNGERNRAVAPGGLKPRPTVSVIMAVRDSVATVSASVNSVLEQTLWDWEIVIVDDASSDGTDHVLKEFVDWDSSGQIVVLKNQQHSGLAFSLNRALDVARGRYIARMDADDVALPERLERQAAFLDAHPEVDVLGTWARYRGTTGDKGVLRLPECHSEIVRSLPRRNPLIHPTVMGRAEFFQLNGYDEFIGRGQDYELWVRTAPLARFHNLPEVLLEYSKPAPQPFSSHWHKALLRVRVGYRAGKLPTFAWWAVYYLIRAILKGEARLT